MCGRRGKCILSTPLLQKCGRQEKCNLSTVLQQMCDRREKCNLSTPLLSFYLQCVGFEDNGIFSALWISSATIAGESVLLIRQESKTLKPTDSF